MTRIKFFKTQDYYMGLEISGHTGYARAGKDILCAAISGMSQSCMLGITNVLGIKAKVTRDDNSGYLKIELPSNLRSEKLNDAQILFKTLHVSLEDLMTGYSKYISMEVIENDY